MSTSFAATERERYEELVKALMELAKVLMTFTPWPGSMPLT
jgi:hypothetical protein